MSAEETPGEVTPAEKARFQDALKAVITDPDITGLAKATAADTEEKQEVTEGIMDRLQNLNVFQKAELWLSYQFIKNDSPAEVLGKLVDGIEGMQKENAPFPDGDDEGPRHYKLPSTVENIIEDLGVPSENMMQGFTTLSEEDQAKMLEVVNATLDAYDLREPGATADIQISNIEDLERLMEVPEFRAIMKETTIAEFVNGEAGPKIQALAERLRPGTVQLAEAASEIAHDPEVAENLDEIAPGFSPNATAHNGKAPGGLGG